MSERTPPLTFKPNVTDDRGDECDWIESEDETIKLWFEAGDVDPNLLRLFAAAPDLLAACEAVKAWSYRCRYCLPNEPCELHAKVRAALAKAKPAQ